MPGERYCGRTGWLIVRTQPERKKLLWEGLWKGLRAGKGQPGCLTLLSEPEEKTARRSPKPEPGPHAFAIATQKKAWRTFSQRTGWIIGQRTQPERKNLLWEGLGKGLRAGKRQPGCLTLLSEPEEKTARRSPKPEPGPHAFAIATQNKAWRTLLWEDRVAHCRANTA